MEGIPCDCVVRSGEHRIAEADLKTADPDSESCALKHLIQFNFRSSCNRFHNGKVIDCQR